MASQMFNVPARVSGKVRVYGKEVVKSAEEAVTQSENFTTFEEEGVYILEERIS